MNLTPDRPQPDVPEQQQVMSTQAAKFELVSLEAAEVASCGSKAAACSRLLQLAQASGGLFQAPQGAVIPFGIMNLALKVLPCSVLHVYFIATYLFLVFLCRQVCSCQPLSQSAGSHGRPTPMPAPRQLQEPGQSCWQAEWSAAPALLHAPGQRMCLVVSV